MKIELIPVIEITNYDEDLNIPDNGPYWKYQDDWELYRQLSNKKAGFKEDLTPYLKGSPLYRMSDISHDDLLKLVLEQTQEMREHDNDRELCSAFSGGYILRIDNEDKIFPQCCSDLGSIESWHDLVTEQILTYYQGHPTPVVSFIDNFIIFDLTTKETDSEKFVPTPLQTIVKVNKEELAIAVEEVQKELQEFSIKLSKINTDNQLHIDNIEKLLIFGQYD